MKQGLLIALIFLMSNTVHCSGNKISCLICRGFQCKCENYGCDENDRMSLKKLILHFLKTNQNSDGARLDSEDETYKPIVRFLKDVLKRASCHNINEEISIRDMIITRLKILHGKCTCLEEPHETLLKQFLKLLLEKCLDCDSGVSECDCAWRSRTCDSSDGMFWFRTVPENLREESHRVRCEDGGPVKEQHRKQLRKNQSPDKQCTDFDYNYKCPRFMAEECLCSKFSVCTDCKNCQIFVVKHKDDIWLICEGCKVINSPYVQFTTGGFPVKIASDRGVRQVRIRTKYLQLNDFRDKKDETDKCVFECPSILRVGHPKPRRRSST